ncbi:Aste57867_22493 [Aphanomyces stellatus]|uniref:Aste57867_22493 protein n=1 Tax=Aphanomyces stellatus TaxID=120398 RepID=A0A485LL30_9STRA|nr:hypothetical protein As57867_022423 [Aphanomyces stellatus]VFT99153.1 Aste57867_22493 [Aphanomyces stellatus]
MAPFPILDRMTGNLCRLVVTIPPPLKFNLQFRIRPDILIMPTFLGKLVPTRHHFFLVTGNKGIFWISSSACHFFTCMMHTTRDPVVFIHGMPPSSIQNYIHEAGIFGWGEPTPFFNLFPSYWPRQALDELNTNHMIVDVGKVSSDHDRACEAFYQLYGGQVDYGDVHSRNCGHARFGATFKPKHPGWGEEHPVHLLGHSFGGTTAIELYQMLCVNYFNVGSSYKWVKSITTIASPLTGSTLGSALGAEMDKPVPFLSGVHVVSILVCGYWKLSVALFPFLRRVVDFNMDQWLDVTPWSVLYSNKHPFLDSQDNSLHASFPAFRVMKNKHLVHMDKVHLFNIVTTAKDQHMYEAVGLVCLLWLFYQRWQFTTKSRLPSIRIWAMAALFYYKRQHIDLTNATTSLWALVYIMRRYVQRNTANHGLDSDTWAHNDGVVNTFSQVYPRVHLNQTKTATDDTLLPRCRSYISVDLTQMTAEEGDESGVVLPKGQWHIHRVEKNHLCGTVLDSHAREMYAQLFQLLEKNTGVS